MSISIRNNKRRVMYISYFRAWWRTAMAPILATIDKISDDTAIEVTPSEETISSTFTVARKKDGVVVATYETEEEALEVIAKAKASKKAALHIVVAS